MRQVCHSLQVDVQRVHNAIKKDKIQADFVVVRVHSHLMNGSSEVPTEFIVEVCHNCVDSSANAIFGHGTHELQGIEACKAVPILWDGGLYFHNEFQEDLPKEFFEKKTGEIRESIKYRLVTLFY